MDLKHIDDPQKKDEDTGDSSKNNVLKGTGCCSPQMKKPQLRILSSLNWSPRKKAESYLMRKIRRLQEAGGMTATLDEILGDSNPHYPRVMREKIAARNAACRAMEARKAAMVEASWSRILRAARIQSEEAEALLQQAAKISAEAFEAATGLGVVMYDRPDCPRTPCEVESSSINTGGTTTHTVSACFETAFEVDIEVAYAVKKALILLADCPSSSDKVEYKDLLRKISQNPDTNEATKKNMECPSCYSSDTKSEVELESLGEISSSHYTEKQNKCKNNWLIDIMLERLKRLKENELASLATIVATCGLNAVLREVKNDKHHDSKSVIDYAVVPDGNSTKNCVLRGRKGQTRGEQVVVETPSLDKCLVKHMSRLEKEVEEARRRNIESDGQSVDETLEGPKNSLDRKAPVSEIPSLGNCLVKHFSKLEREVWESQNTRLKNIKSIVYNSHGSAASCEDIAELHDFYNVSREDGKQLGKENIDSNNVHRVEMEKARVCSEEEKKKVTGIDLHVQDCASSLDGALVKCWPEFEEELMPEQLNDDVKISRSRQEARESEMQAAWGGLSLGNSLRPHHSRLVQDKKARESEMQAAWGGLSLGNSLRPHHSRLVQDKAAWIKAEKEEKRQSRRGMQT